MKIDIPNPCPEKWDSMKSTKEGAFCGVCNKNLVDFTKKSPAEIKEHLQNTKEDYTCAKMSNEQILDLNFDGFFQRFRFWNLTKKIALVLFFTLGLGLFSCKSKQHRVGTIAIDHDQDVVGKVAPEKNDTKVGLIEYQPPADSAKKINPKL